MTRMNPLDNASLRRAVALLIGAGALVLNKKLDLELDAQAQEWLTLIVMSYILGGNAKEAMMARAAAASTTAGAQVKTVDEALAVIKGPQP